MSVTATDAGGSSGTATQSFVVTVPNEGPVTVGTLADRTLRVSDGSVTADVSTAFSDPDDDALTFTAVSSAPVVATLSVSGATLTLTAVSSGSSTVTVTATDAGGSSGTATQSFVVTVPNEGPVTVGTLADRTLRVSDGSVTADVSTAFSDPDDDALTFTAVSSAPVVATLSVSGATLTLTAVSSGSSTVTVTATDAGGSSGTATQSFVVTVPNEGPVTVGTLADRTLRVSDGSVTVDVSTAFSDPDDDALTFTAVSSAPVVATLSVSGATLTLTAVSSGSSTVTVTATDAGGSSGTATQTFAVTVSEDDSLVPVGTLSDRTLRVLDGPLTVDVSGAFSDRRAIR